MTQYLLQQEDPLPVFSQVVCSKAALDASPNHNGIPGIFLSSHDAHLVSPVTTEPTHKGKGKRTGLKEEE